MSDLNDRVIRVALAADAYTRDDLTDTAALDALCVACEQISDAELAELRVAVEDPGGVNGYAFPAYTNTSKPASAVRSPSNCRADDRQQGTHS